MFVTSSIFRRQHQKLAPLTLAAADVYRHQDITCKILCNINSYALNSVSSECRFLSSTKRYRSDDTDSKASNKDSNEYVKINNNEFSFFGGSNFQQMLQYQNVANQPSRSQPKKTIHSKEQDQLAAVHNQTQSIRHRQHSKNSSYNRMRTRQAASRRLYDRRDGMNKNTADASTLEPAAPSSKKLSENDDAKPRKVASSDWILVSNIPPMSKLSDIISGIEKIIAFEMDKGVIDLDKIEEYVSSGVNLKQRRGNLDKIGARESFYATEHIDLSSGIPLWAPDLEDGELPSHMVMEARLHLSQHARPKGWFLRLPSRSIVHAILNHNREAEKPLTLERRRMKSEEDYVKSERRRWRQGLWKGVWGEHENKSASNETKQLLEKEKEEEWNLAFGVESDERLNLHDEHAASVDAVTTADVTTANVDEAAIVDGEDREEAMSLEDDPHAIAFAYLDEYAQSKPYPEQFKTGPHPNSSGYHRLTCGSAELKIDEFNPEPQAYRLRSWEQASFQISPMLNLSDSVVRLETEALGKSVDDIQYLFRGYDLESILPEKVSSTPLLPRSCVDYARALGWNVKGEGKNVDILVDGRAKTVNPRHTFLVRFASASSARMAVRDELRFRQGDDMLTMTQFPKSWL
eukprot:scaffold6075_cov112-Skeletonema_dohrnii-CCMP3373.AAC.1